MLPAVGQESIWRGAIRSATIALAVGAAFMSCSLDSPVFAASAADDPLGCSGQIYDPAAVAGPALAAAATTVATRLGADLHVRIERSLDGDIDARELLLERQCTTWLGADGLRLPNLLVVMVSPSERQTSIYFGANFSAALTAAGPEIQTYVMNPLFKSGDVSGGLVAGLQSIAGAVNGEPVAGAQAPTYDGSTFTLPAQAYSSPTTHDSGSPPIGLIIALIAVIAVIGIASKLHSDASSGPDGDGGGGWGSGLWRSTSFSGLSGSRSHSSYGSGSSGSSHGFSSSGGSHGSSSSGGGGGSSSSW